MLPTQQVEWLIPQINSISLEKMDLQNDISIFQKNIEDSDDYVMLQECKQKLKNLEEQEAQLREQWKQIMLDNGLKKLDMLDGTTIQLNSTPWALIVAEWVQLDPKYYKEKVTVTMDKVMVKKDFMDWLILDPGVTIQSDFNFVIKSK